MKTLRFFIVIFFALIVVIACEPDEEIVPNIKENLPTLPFDLEAKALFDNQENQDGFSVMLNWQNTSENAKGFIVERSLGDSTKWSEVTRLGRSITSFTDTQTGKDSIFYYRVVAIEKDQTFSFSKSITISKTITITAPTDLILTAQSSSTIFLEWEDQSSNETGFSIQRTLNSNDSRSWREVAKVGANTKQYEDTGLEVDTKYFYRVLAYKVDIRNLSNNTNSDPSNVAEATTWDQILASGSSHSKNFTFTENCELVNVLINGNISMLNGTLRLVNCNIQGNITKFGDGNIEIIRDIEQEGNESSITGNIKEFGAGSIKVNGTEVIGNIVETGTGDLVFKNESSIGKVDHYTYVLNEEGLGNIEIENSYVKADIGEKSQGSISILNCHRVYGDIGEQNYGDIIIRDSNVNANKIGEQSDGNIIIENSNISENFTNLLSSNSSIAEQGYGYIRISNSNVIGNLNEQDSGNIDIRDGSNIGDASFPGNVKEKDGGSVYLRDTSVIWGNLAESGYGRIYVEILVNIYGNISYG